MTKPLYTARKACVIRVMRAFSLLPVLIFAAALHADGVSTASAKPHQRTAPNVYLAETAWFSLFGDSTETNARAADIANRIGVVLERHGFRAADLGPTRINLYVNSGDGNGGLDNGGGKTSVRLTKALLADEPATARLLARAVLHRLAQAAGKPADPSDWAIAAIALDARVAGAPGLVDHLVREAKKLGPASPGELAAHSSSLDDARRELSAFWLLKALRGEASGDPRVPLAEASMGVPLADTLKKIIPDLSAGGERAEAWWPTAFYRQVATRGAPVESLEDSEKNFRKISRIVADSEGRDHPLDLEAIIARRKNPAMTEEARNRVLVIKSELPGINPVWINAHIAYGLFLEKLPSAESDELRRLHAEAMKEVSIAQKTTEEIQRVTNARR